METAIAKRRERITCDEEERLKYGYDLATYFRYDDNNKTTATVIDNQNTPHISLTFGNTATIWRINRGLKRSKEKGFKLDITDGTWGNSNQEEILDNIETEVILKVSDTCDILIVKAIDLPEHNSEDFLITFQYALERAICAVYKLETNELTSERIGDGKSLLFWETAEGGAGVLSQILEDPKAFQKLADAALDICHFKVPKENCTQACYQCLLTYQNQFDHPQLNRHLIRSFLEKLKVSTLNRNSQGSTRQEKYQELLHQTDPNSEFERIVLKEIYQQGKQLPDSAQEFIPEVNCKPDFIYKKQRIAIFCDGSVHDSLARQQQDKIKRENLEWELGYIVISLRYDENWREKLNFLK